MEDPTNAFYSAHFVVHIDKWSKNKTKSKHTKIRFPKFQNINTSTSLNQRLGLIPKLCISKKSTKATSKQPDWIPANNVSVGHFIKYPCASPISPSFTHKNWIPFLHHSTSLSGIPSNTLWTKDLSVLHIL